MLLDIASIQRYLRHRVYTRTPIHHRSQAVQEFLEAIVYLRRMKIQVEKIFRRRSFYMSARGRRPFQSAQPWVDLGTRLPLKSKNEMKPRQKGVPTNNDHFSDEDKTGDRQLMSSTHKFQSMSDDFLLAPCQDSRYAIRFRH
jgi:hypothetical protein